MRHLSLCSTLFPYTTLFRSNLGVDWRNIYYGWFFNSSGIVSRATSWDFFIPVSQRAIARKSSRFFLIEPNREHYPLDRKSTRLNSSHVAISYAVFCLKKKKI